MKRREWGTLCLTLPGRVLLLLADGKPWQPKDIRAALGIPARGEPGKQRGARDPAKGDPSSWTVRRALTRLRETGAVDYERAGNAFYWHIRDAWVAEWPGNLLREARGMEAPDAPSG